MNSWRLIAVASSCILAGSVQATLIDVFQGDIFSGVPGPHFFKGTIEAYTGADSAVDNYNYFSASGHPTEGPNLKFNRGEIFFYDGPEGTTFNVLFNKEKSKPSDPVTDGLVSWNIQAISFPPGDPNVLLSDDKKELKETDPDFFKGRWEWHNNTDGGIIQGFNDPFWAIAIDPKEYQGIDSLKVFSADGDRINLNLSTGPRGFIFFSLHPSNVPDAGAGILLLSGGLLIVGATSPKFAKR